MCSDTGEALGHTGCGGLREHPARPCVCAKSEAPGGPSRVPAPGSAGALRALQALLMPQIKEADLGPGLL
uniref:Uncharacterized protein n=1 Tax=Rangifer tarandus platyrhynchus TaxID=3082113 RepID=A0ACB0F3J5_RANTA|nr:unnamed protein product [Rangifer tarandus platyrhynchus]